MPQQCNSVLDRNHGTAHTVSSGGAVAQLGERVVRNDEVVGSIPIGSTRKPRLTT